MLAASLRICAGTLFSRLSLLYDAHNEGLLCDAHTDGLLCDAHNDGLLCDAHSEGLLCDAHIEGLLYAAHNEGLLCDPHTEISIDPLCCCYCILFVQKQHAITAAHRINADFSVSMRRKPEFNSLCLGVPTVLL